MPWQVGGAQVSLKQAGRLGLPQRLFLLGVGLALRARLELVIAAAAIGAAFGRLIGMEHRCHSQECTKRFPVAAIA
ncbi:hypothetical protein A9K66_28280 [Mesorhizobium sp. AA23]|nr:hypothetical protein A9K66_28280 [Mesorhizobium sp. AA23]